MSDYHRVRTPIDHFIQKPLEDQRLALGPDAPPAFRLEPLGYQLHLYTPEDGLVSHIVSVGDWPGPYPFFADGKLID